MNKKITVIVSIVLFALLLVFAVGYIFWHNEIGLFANGKIIINVIIGILWLVVVAASVFDYLGGKCEKREFFYSLAFYLVILGIYIAAALKYSA